MTLLAPVWLLAGALGGIVLLLHATRRREVAVPSLQLWRLLGASGARQRIRRRPPLTAALLLQLLAVALAVLALAQPRIGGTVAEHYVFVLDGSGSMRATDAPGSRFASARADLEAAIGALAADGDVRVSVVLAGASPRLVVARQGRPAGIMPLVQALEAGDGGGDWQATFATLGAVLRDGETALVTVLTDDAGGAVAASAAALPSGTPVETVGYGRPDTPDAALAARLIAVDAAAGRWRVEGTVTLHAGAPVPAEIAVAYAPGAEGGLLDWAPIVVRPPRATEATADGPVTVPFGGELELPGEGRLRLALPGDAAGHDDAVYFAVRGAGPLRVLVVGPADDTLVRALAALGAVETRVADRLPADLSQIDLVVVTAVVERRPETNVLWLGRGRLAGEAEPAYLPASDPTYWDDRHPLSRNVDWAALEGPAAFGVPGLPGAEILLAAGDAPLLQARTTSAGREVRLALDLAGSPFVDSPAFPVLLANVAAWLGEAPRPCVAGLTCAIAARDLAARIEAPDGSVAWTGIAFSAAMPTGLDQAFIPARAGFHTAIRTDGTVTAYAVNAPPGESGVAVSDGPGGSLPVPPVRLGGWLAGAVFLVLLVEAVVSGRGRERFLRWTALRSGSPGGGRRRMLLAIRIATCGAVLAAITALPVPVREPGEAIFAIALPDEAAAAPFAAAALQAAEDGRATFLSADSGGGQNIEDAVRLAAAMLPADRAGRIVIGTDGNETAGALGTALPELLARSIRLDAEPLPAMPGGEVLVGRVEAGSHVRAGDAFPLSALVWSQSGGEAELTILRDGEIAVSETAVLRAGWNRVDTVMPAAASRTLVEVTVSSAADSFPGNNRNGTMIIPDAAPRILVLSPDMDWGAFFADALRVQNLSAEVLSPDRAPRAIAGWLAYDVVVLMNMPALSLTTAQQELLEEAVHDHGRGLVILGGERAFGPGGYYATALERLSPLSSRVPQETPRAAIVFVLDRSGSMQAPVDDLIRLDIAREATIGAVMLLNEESEVGIVVFDSEAQVLVPMQRPRGAAVRAALAPLEPGGGTELFPALTAALGLFEGVTAETKHIVVITDGLVEPVDFSALLGEIVAAGITVSTVAVGTSAITDKLAGIAADGGGAYHATADFKALPGILAQEAMYLTTSPVTVGTRPVRFVDRSAPFLANLPAELPPIENFVATTAKPDADLHVVTVDDAGETMPLLASWRYGIGRVLAFATHGAGPGTRQWLAIPEYPLLWAQAVRAFLPGVAAPGLHLELVRDGDRVRVDAYSVDAGGAAIEDAALAATIDGGPPLPLTGGREGHSTVSFPAPPGTHEIAVAGEEATAEGAIHLGYAALLDFTRAHAGDLAAAADVTGGTITGAAAALATGDAWRLRSEWRPWLVLALMLLLADLALRQARLPTARAPATANRRLGTDRTPPGAPVVMGADPAAPSR